MAVKMARERYLWLLQIDWPVHLRTKRIVSIGPGPFPPAPFRKISFAGNLKRAARELADWMDTNIGEDNWAIEYSEVQDDHDLMSNMDYEAFVIRVKTEEEAVLVQMKWS